MGPTEMTVGCNNIAHCSGKDNQARQAQLGELDVILNFSGK